METASFYIHLYCDNDETDEQHYKDQYGHFFNEFPHEYTAPTRAKCVKDARNGGWIFHRDGKHSCPKCSGKRNRKPND